MTPIEVLLWGGFDFSVRQQFFERDIHLSRAQAVGVLPQGTAQHGETDSQTPA